MIHKSKNEVALAEHNLSLYLNNKALLTESEFQIENNKKKDESSEDEVEQIYQINTKPTEVVAESND